LQFKEGVMRLKSALFNGLDWDAILTADAPDSAEGIPVILLSNNEVLSTSDAEFGEFKIVDASDAERTLLAQGGYTLADWTEEDEVGNPDEGGSCHPAPQDA
jgi:hypothetical protein